MASTTPPRLPRWSQKVPSSSPKWTAMHSIQFKTQFSTIRRDQYKLMTLMIKKFRFLVKCITTWIYKISNLIIVDQTHLYSHRDIRHCRVSFKIGAFEAKRKDCWGAKLSIWKFWMFKIDYKLKKLSKKVQW